MWLYTRGNEYISNVIFLDTSLLLSGHKLIESAELLLPLR